MKKTIIGIIIPLWVVIYALPVWAGPHQDAIKYATKAIESGELDEVQEAAAYNTRCSAYGNIGEYTLALADCDKALEINPEMDRTYINRGMVYVDKGEAEKAAADFTEAIRLKPENPLSYYNRANVRVKQGREGEALDDYNRVIAIDAEYASAYYNRGLILGKAGKLEEAKESLVKAAELQSYNGKYARGVEWIEQTIEYKKQQEENN